MSELVDDLVAVKALIDTPKKYRAHGTVWGAMLAYWGRDTDDSDRAYFALEMKVPRFGNHLRRYEEEAGITHADVMAVFDRAIEAAKAGAA